MSELVIPTRTDIPAYSEQVDLGQVTYTFDLAWNYREEAWYLSIGDAVGTPIVSGVKVVVGQDLLAAVSNPARPPGVLMALDSSGADADPGLEDLGARVQLLYQEPGS